MTRGELVERMSIAEFHEWMLYEQLEPFGDRRGDIQAGMICTTIANIHKAKNTQAFKVTDFLPSFGIQDRQPQSVEQQLEIMLAIQKAQNATVKANA